MEPACPRCGEPSEGLCPRCTGYLLRFEPYVLRPGLPGPPVDAEVRREVALLSIDPKGAVRFLNVAPSREGESFHRQFLRHVGVSDRGASLTRGDRETIHRICRAWVNAPPRSEDMKAVARALYAEAAALPDMPPEVAQRFQSLAQDPAYAPVAAIPPPVHAEPASNDEAVQPLASPPEVVPKPDLTEVPQGPSPTPKPVEAPLPSPSPRRAEPSKEETPSGAAAVALAEEKRRLAAWFEEQQAEVERRRGMVRSQLDEIQLRESDIAEREQRMRAEEAHHRERLAELQRKAEEASTSDPARALYLRLFSLEGVSREAAAAIANAFVTEDALRAASVERIAGVRGVLPEEGVRVRDAIREGPKEGRDLRQKAEELLEEERFQEALEVFDTIARENPEEVDAWFNRAEVLALLDRPAEAGASLDRALKIDPTHKATLREFANLLFEQGDFGLAAAHLNKFLKHAPHEAEHWLGRAADLVAEGKATDATLIYNAILEGDATNLSASLALGDLLLAMDDVERADRLYSRALQHHPNSPEAFLKKGLLFNRQGRWGAAVQMFNRALSLRFDYREAWAAKAQVLLTQGKAKEALEAFDRLVALDTTQFDAWVGKARAHLAAGENDKAAEAAGRALSLNKGNAEAQAILRQLGWEPRDPAEPPERLGKPSEATIDPGVLTKIADSFLEAGDGEAALQGYQEVLLGSPTNAKALFGKGRALHMLDRYAEALRCFTDAVKAAPGVEEYARWKKTCAERVGKEGRA